MQEVNAVLDYIAREADPRRDFEEHDFSERVDPSKSIEHLDGMVDTVAETFRHRSWYLETPIKMVRGAVIGGGIGALADLFTGSGPLYANYGVVIGMTADAVQYSIRGGNKMLTASPRESRDQP